MKGLAEATSEWVAETDTCCNLGSPDPGSYRRDLKYQLQGHLVHPLPTLILEGSPTCLLPSTLGALPPPPNIAGYNLLPAWLPETFLVLALPLGLQGAPLSPWQPPTVTDGDPTAPST